MDYRLYIECDGDFLEGYEKIADDVAGECFKRFPAPKKLQLSLYIVDEEEIRSANRSQRGIDKVTDVLSFPTLPFTPENKTDFNAIDTEDPGNIDPESGDLLLGEVMICRKKVYAQAEEYGHAPEREFAFLFAHACLHLLGFDHEEEEDRKCMEDLQEEILKEAGYER